MGWLWPAPSDLVLSPDTLLQPDLRIDTVGPGPRPANDPAILLVVEILSPSTARRDRHLKRHAYLHAGARMYWVVDCDSAHVEQWTPADDRPLIVTDTLRWHPPGASVPFVFDLPLFFADVNRWPER